MRRSRGPTPNGQRKETGWEDYWGSSWQTKAKQSLCVGFCNIGGLGVTNKHIRNHQLPNSVSKHQIDIMRVTEVNVNWKRVPHKDCLHERVKGWWENSRNHFTCKSTNNKGT